MNYYEMPLLNGFHLNGMSLECRNYEMSFLFTYAVEIGPHEMSYQFHLLQQVFHRDLTLDSIEIKLIILHFLT